MNKGTWIEVLKKNGLDEKGMENWHRAFESCAPLVHQDFLESLNIPQDEIDYIRKKSEV